MPTNKSHYTDVPTTMSIPTHRQWYIDNNDDADTDKQIGTLIDADEYIDKPTMVYTYMRI